MADESRADETRTDASRGYSGNPAAYGQRRSAPPIDSKLHPHADRSQLHGQRTAERAAMDAAIKAKMEEVNKPPAPELPRKHEAEQLEDHQGRRPEKRENYITLTCWHNSVIIYAHVKTDS